MIKCYMVKKQERCFMKSLKENQPQRERLGSRLGFILLSAGCAVGIGNVWKFPWMVGQYGGGLFVLLYYDYGVRSW